MAVSKDSTQFLDMAASATRVTSVDASGVAVTAPGSPAPVAATGATTSVASWPTAVTLKAANAARLGLTIWNDSTQVLYALVGAGTVTSSVYTVQLAAGAYYELPFRFTGIVTGLWASANGNARVTEITA